MPLDLSNTLVIGISATALFDMSESDRMFRETYATDPDSAIEKYRAYMLEHENQPLQPEQAIPWSKRFWDSTSTVNPMINHRWLKLS